jgi:hypothetical protein
MVFAFMGSIMPKSPIRLLAILAVIFSPLLFDAGPSAQVAPGKPDNAKESPDANSKKELKYLNPDAEKTDANLNNDPKYLNVEDAKPAASLNDDTKTLNLDTAKTDAKSKSGPNIDLNAQESISPSYWK